LHANKQREKDLLVRKTTLVEDEVVETRSAAKETAEVMCGRAGPVET